MLILWIWALSAAFVMSKFDEIGWDKLEKLLVDFAWESYYTKDQAKIMLGIVVLVASPLYAVVILTKSLRTKK